MPESPALAVALAALLTTVVPAEKKTITAAEARTHLGEDVTVCGRVVSVRKANAPRAGASWQIYLDQDTPPVFALIASANLVDNPFFVTADSRFSGKDVCADGKVMEHSGLAYIRLTQPRQIRVVKDKPNP
jgi:DNA/RNA endonuclease YhcR with UshA esterase domain